MQNFAGKWIWILKFFMKLEICFQIFGNRIYLSYTYSSIANKMHNGLLLYL